MNQVNYQDLSSETLNGLLNFSGYFHRIGLTKDYKLMLDIYGTLFPELKDVTRLGIDVVSHTKIEVERDWGNEAKKLWKRLEQLEPYVMEAGRMDDYFRVLTIFVQPFQYISPIFAQKFDAFQEKERKLKHGTAKKFSRIQTDPDVKIERCADCPGSQQQGSNLKGPRTFKANKSNKVLTRDERVKEAREKLLSEDL